MKHLDLFSGIGGFALAARWVGWETIGFCEIDTYCQKVLAKHWPGVPIYDDIKTVMADTDSERRGKARRAESGRRVSGRCASTGRTITVGPVDVITGGFPCQDISYAGKGAGIDGERSGLWTELARVIGEVRPRYAVLENVSALLSRGLDRVTGDLAEIGYNCEWHCIPASAVGAPHRRDRIWIICYPNKDSEPACAVDAEVSGLPEAVPDTLRPERQSGAGRRGVRQGDSELADTASKRVERNGAAGIEKPQAYVGEKISLRGGTGSGGGQWAVEPSVRGVVDGLPDGFHGYRGRVAHGVPNRIHRLRALGNAIVPQCAQLIFEAINDV